MPMIAHADNLPSGNVGIGGHAGVNRTVKGASKEISVRQNTASHPVKASRGEFGQPDFRELPP